jgi:hypothetical protein
MKLIEEIHLPNGLTLKVWDRSRAIAVDTTKVEILLQVEVLLKEEYFDQPNQCEKTRQAFGPAPCFEYYLERAFVPSNQKDDVVRELLDGFSNNVLSYVSKKDFPEQFARSRWRAILKNPYKYGGADNHAHDP